MNIQYITIEQAVEIHKKTVEKSGGGVIGHLELGKLEGVLGNIQNDLYYPTFADKLTHLFFSVCKFHCFLDGNKRIAIVLCTQFLLLNGYLYCAERFLQEMENISYHVADGSVDKDLLKELIAASLEEELDSEALKLKLLQAISKDN
ncbi:MAG: type II toxin-antitoxin system death-on-curing family toxin [Deltaproteobacteria bacterium]|nr:type II toxin-antitoxin system death-on-curing family toxin [Deltaproteobacteria bacterium]